MKFVTAKCTFKAYVGSLTEENIDFDINTFVFHKLFKKKIRITKYQRRNIQKMYRT